MKKLLSALCVLLAAILIGTPAAMAAETDAAPVGAVYAVATTENGRTAKIAAPDAEDMDDLAGYALYVAQEPVLRVGSHAEETAGAAYPTYYHVQFMIPDTTEEVYLTGLRAEYVEQIQQAILDRIFSGTSFELTDLGFIDTEKTAAADNDENLCWAASTADILQYTGWAAKAGFANEDDLFEAFIQSFGNNGSHQTNALAWFFNSAALRLNLGLLGARIRNYPFSGGYLKDYAYDMVSESRYIENSGDMHRMETLLHEGCGVSLGIMLYDSNGNGGGHAVTLWGMVTDTALRTSDPKRYKSLLITDSDSHFADGNRRDATDALTLYPLDTSHGFAFHYYDDVTAVPDDYIALVPYSSSVPRETDLAAARSKTAYPDLTVAGLYVDGNDELSDQAHLFESGGVTFGGTIANTSDKRYRANATLDVSVTNQNNSTLFSQSERKYTSLSYVEQSNPYIYSVSNVPAGDYTLQYTVNQKRPVTEAYYYNNVQTIAFKVRDSYLCGDFNGDGAITIDDATAIQRFLSELTTADEKAVERGNADGDVFNISDATEIQRALADLSTMNIGKKMLHTVI